jgi:hypothetical protein
VERHEQSARVFSEVFDRAFNGAYPTDVSHLDEFKLRDSKMRALVARSMDITSIELIQSLGIVRGFLFGGRVANVRFGSFAIDTFRTSANQCPLLLQ